jgi:hypothetical protein
VRTFLPVAKIEVRRRPAAEDTGHGALWYLSFFSAERSGHHAENFELCYAVLSKLVLAASRPLASLDVKHVIMFRLVAVRSSGLILTSSQAKYQGIDSKISNDGQPFPDDHRRRDPSLIQVLMG